MTSSEDEGDWDRDEYLQPSSEHGSDGEIYQVEPSQKDEQMRQYRRRKSRLERADESPSRAPRPSAVASELSTARLYTPHGPLDSQTDSQSYISDIYHAAGMTMQTQSQPPCGESLSLEVTPKSEPQAEGSLPALSEVEQLREQLRQMREELATTRSRLEEERDRFFTLLEQANQERDTYRERASKWEAHAANVVPFLHQAKDKISAALEDLEFGI
ncbi:hypothetical protein FB451DRAFT_1258113 [Mycena latifolia]|nr:hypothetical protein FB451DRAFT_1258113 [Mycena latifolia]